MRVADPDTDNARLCGRESQSGPFCKRGANGATAGGSEFKPLPVAILSLLLLVSMLVPYGRTAIALALLPLSLMGRGKALFALLVLFLIRIANTAIVAVDPLLPVAAWATVLAASARIWLDFAVRNQSGVVRHLNVLLPFGLFVFVAMALSAFSLSPVISFLKGFAFFLVAGAILVGVTLQSPGRSDILVWLHAAWMSVLATSVLILAFPEVGYFRDGEGFQGALSHPQVLGVFLAPLFAWLLVRVLGERRLRPGLLLVLLLTIAVLFLTRARTGLASVMLATALLGLFRTGGIRTWLRWLARRKVALLLVPAVVLATPMFYAEFRDGIEQYLFKTASSDELGEAFQESRGFLILQAIDNFRAHPFTGIGFGVASSETHEFNVDVDPMTGLPIGAVTEKASLPIAVLEETGLIGALFFAVFFWQLLRAVANTRDTAIALAALTAISTNISEMTFFSMNFFGTYVWLLCAVAVAAAPPENSRARELWAAADTCRR